MSIISEPTSVGGAAPDDESIDESTDVFQALKQAQSIADLPKLNDEKWTRFLIYIIDRPELYNYVLSRYSIEPWSMGIKVVISDKQATDSEVQAVLSKYNQIDQFVVVLKHLFSREVKKRRQVHVLGLIAESESRALMEKKAGAIIRTIKLELANIHPEALASIVSTYGTDHSAYSHGKIFEILCKKTKVVDIPYIQKYMKSAESDSTGTESLAIAMKCVNFGVCQFLREEYGASSTIGDEVFGIWDAKLSTIELKSKHAKSYRDGIMLGALFEYYDDVSQYKHLKRNLSDVEKTLKMRYKMWEFFSRCADDTAPEIGDSA